MTAALDMVNLKCLLHTQSYWTGRYICESEVQKRGLDCCYKTGSHSLRWYLRWRDRMRCQTSIYVCLLLKTLQWVPASCRVKDNVFTVAHRPYMKCPLEILDVLWFCFLYHSQHITHTALLTFIRFKNVLGCSNIEKLEKNHQQSRLEGTIKQSKRKLGKSVVFWKASVSGRQECQMVLIGQERWGLKIDPWTYQCGGYRQPWPPFEWMVEWKPHWSA